MKLTRNFSLSELFGNYPDPTQEQITAAWQLAAYVLQPIRDEFGPILITSGARMPEHNQRIGGSPTSQHIFSSDTLGGIHYCDAAADIALGGGRHADHRLRLQVYQFAADRLLTSISQLIWYEGTTHLHIGLATPRLQPPGALMMKPLDPLPDGRHYRVLRNSVRAVSDQIAELDHRL